MILAAAQCNTKKATHPPRPGTAPYGRYRDLQPVEKGPFIRHKPAILHPTPPVTIELARAGEHPISDDQPLLYPLTKRIFQFEIGCGRPGHDRRRLQTIALPQQATLHRPGSNTTKLSAEFVD